MSLLSQELLDDIAEMERKAEAFDALLEAVNPIFAAMHEEVVQDALFDYEDEEPRIRPEMGLSLYAGLLRALQSAEPDLSDRMESTPKSIKPGQSAPESMRSDAPGVPRSVAYGYTVKCTHCDNMGFDDSMDTICGSTRHQKRPCHGMFVPILEDRQPDTEAGSALED